MSWQKTAAIRPSDPSPESEYKRLRAYESLFVVVIMIAAALAFGGTIAIAVSSSLGNVTHQIAPGP
jgi:hypothetical protein